MVNWRALIGGLLFGGLAGVALGVLAAPQSGARLRSELVDASGNFYRKAIYELEELSEKIDELRAKLEDEAQSLAQKASLAPEPMEDFSPGPELERKIGRAQEALSSTEHTTAESQELLRRTETPALQPPTDPAERPGA